MKNQVPWDFRLIALLIGLSVIFLALGAVMWLIAGNILWAIAWGLGAFSLFRTARALWVAHPAGWRRAVFWFGIWTVAGLFILTLPAWGGSVAPAGYQFAYIALAVSVPFLLWLLMRRDVYMEIAQERWSAEAESGEGEQKRNGDDRDQSDEELG